MAEKLVTIRKSVKGGGLVWEGPLSANTKVMMKAKVKENSKCKNIVWLAIYRVTREPVFGVVVNVKEIVFDYGWLSKGEEATIEICIPQDGRYEIWIEAGRAAKDCDIDIEVCFSERLIQLQ